MLTEVDDEARDAGIPSINSPRHDLGLALHQIAVCVDATECRREFDVPDVLGRVKLYARVLEFMCPRGRRRLLRVVFVVYEKSVFVVFRPFAEIHFNIRIVQRMFKDVMHVALNIEQPAFRFVFDGQRFYGTESALFAVGNGIMLLDPMMASTSACRAAQHACMTCLAYVVPKYHGVEAALLEAHTCASMDAMERLADTDTVAALFAADRILHSGKNIKTADNPRCLSTSDDRKLQRNLHKLWTDADAFIYNTDPCKFLLLRI